MCGQFLSTLFSDLILRLVMGVAAAPSQRVCAERAAAAIAALFARNPGTSRILTSSA
jgi:hypothetical protein